MDTEFKRNAQVLVIDDSSYARKVVRTILRDIGILNITEALNAIGALKLLKQQQFDLIICDQHMPGSLGTHLITFLRAQKGSANATVPIILLTGDASNNLVKEAARAGIDAFLRKPISVRDLDVRINAILHGKRPVYNRWLNNKHSLVNSPSHQSNIESSWSDSDFIEL